MEEQKCFFCELWWSQGLRTTQAQGNPEAKDASISPESSPCPQRARGEVLHSPNTWHVSVRNCWFVITVTISEELAGDTVALPPIPSRTSGECGDSPSSPATEVQQQHLVTVR